MSARPVIPAMRRELSAVIGTSRHVILLAFFYIYGLGSALVIGSVSRGPGVIDLATVFWAGGDVAVVVGVGACLARFTRTVRELRLPVPAGTLRRVHALVGAFVIVIPIVLFRIFVPEGRELIGATLIVPLGLWLPRLGRDLGWRRGVGARGEGGRGMGAGASSTHGRHPTRSPSDVIRVFMGSAFAPIPVASGRFAARLLLWVLWGSGLMVAERGISLRPASCVVPTANWVVAVYLAVTGVGIWVWLMASLAGFFHARPAAFAELALLPGLGDAARQRRALYWAVLARPMVLWAFFSGLACLWAWSGRQDARYVELIGGALAFLALFSSYFLVLQLLGKRTVPTTKIMCAVNLCNIPFVTASLVSNAVRYMSKMPGLAGEISLGGLLIVTAIMQFMACRYAWRMARLPHPFLQ